MDGSINPRIERLLGMLSARTNRDGTSKPNYTENVASIRAELARLQSTKGEKNA